MKTNSLNTSYSSIHIKTKNNKSLINNQKTITKTQSTNSNSSKSNSLTNSFQKSFDSKIIISNDSESSLLIPISTLYHFKNLSSSNLNTIYKQIIIEEKKNKFPYLNKILLKKQNNITERHRAVLIDWLVNVHLYLKLSDECLFLSIKTIDLFLARVEKFNKSKLQLLGISSLLISSKYIESFHPRIEDLSSLCEGAYSKDEIIIFEKILFEKIDYNLQQDNIINFYDMLALIFNFNLKDYYFGKYLLEISLLDLNLFSVSRTIIAFAVVYLVMKMNIENHSDYKKCFLYLSNREIEESQVKKSAKEILFLMEKIKITNEYTITIQKYKFLLKENEMSNQIF